MDRTEHLEDLNQVEALVSELKEASFRGDGERAPSVKQIDRRTSPALDRLERASANGELDAEQSARLDSVKRVVSTLVDEGFKRSESRSDAIVSSILADSLGLPTVDDNARFLTRAQKVSDTVPREKDGDLSLVRILRGMICGDWHNAQKEQRAMSGNVGALGGFLVPTSLSAQIIDLARNASVVLNAGALTLPMASPEVTIVKQSGDLTGYWRDENVQVTESAAAFVPIRLKAQSLAALARISIELLEDSQNDFAQVIENSIAQALALALDSRALFGSGSGEPRGLANTPGINEISMGVNGAALTTFSQISNGVQKVAEANGTTDVIVMAPRTFGVIDRLVDSTGQPLVPPASYAALRKLVSNQIPINQVQGSASTASTAFVGAFSQMLIGMRTALTLEVTRVADDAFKNMQVLIRGYLRADVAVMRPDHFTKISGIL